MTKRERILRRIIFVLVLLIIALLLCGLKGVGNPEIVSVEPYTVSRGDTLWDIADEYKPNDMGFREYIDLLCEHNGITADIYPGQAIEVIIWEE